MHYCFSFKWKYYTSILLVFFSLSLFVKTLDVTYHACTNSQASSFQTPIQIIVLRVTCYMLNYSYVNCNVFSDRYYELKDRTDNTNLKS